MRVRIVVEKKKTDAIRSRVKTDFPKLDRLNRMTSGVALGLRLNIGASNACPRQQMIIGGPESMFIQIEFVIKYLKNVFQDNGSGPGPPREYYSIMTKTIMNKY